jgi:hypothetical protein
MHKEFYETFFKNKGHYIDDKKVAKIWIDNGYPPKLFIKDFKLSDKVLAFVLSQIALESKN